MKFKVLSLYLIRQLLISFFVILLLLMLLVFCWNLVVSFAHASENVKLMTLSLGVWLKLFARLHQVLPFSVLCAVLHVVIGLKKSQQLLAMKILGYDFKSVLLPGLVAITFASITLSSFEQKYRSDLMLLAYNKYCQAGQKQFCKLAASFWEFGSNSVNFIQTDPVKAQVRSMAAIKFNPTRVEWYDNIFYKDGAWFSGSEKLPIIIDPSRLKYAGLAIKDQNNKIFLDHYLLFALIFVWLFSWNYWTCLASSNKM